VIGEARDDQVRYLLRRDYRIERGADPDRQLVQRIPTTAPSACPSIPAARRCDILAVYVRTIRAACWYCIVVAHVRAIRLACCYCVPVVHVCATRATYLRSFDFNTPYVHSVRAACLCAVSAAHVHGRRVRVPHL
jgi:hypothetical protein